MGITRTTLAALCVVLVAALLAGDLSAASPKDRLHAKQAQAEAVLAQVNKLNQSFEASVEAWNGARYQLVVTKRELVVDRRRLRVAERQRRIAMAHVAERLRALYESNDDENTTLGIVLGSSSVSDMLDRLDAARAVAAADKKLTEQATRARNRYAQAARAAATTYQRRTVAFQQRDRERQRIGSMLDERKRLLAGVQSEVVKLQAEEAAAEAARQAQLRAAARARLAAEARAAAGSRGRDGSSSACQGGDRADDDGCRSDNRHFAAPDGRSRHDDDHDTSAGPRWAGRSRASGGGNDRASVPRHPVPLGRGVACDRLRLLGPRDVRLCPARHLPAAFRRSAVPARHAVDRSQLIPGDLVFFDALDHVGIYIGGGQFVHAPQTGDVVKITALSDFGTSYVGARRL